MVEVVSAAGAVLTCLGAVLLVLFETRAASPIGLLCVAAGLAAGAWTRQEFAAATILAAVGALAGGLALRASGSPARAAMPTTARIVMAALGAGAAIWLGAFLLDQPGGRALRVSILAVIVIVGAGLAGAPWRQTALFSAAAVALGVGASGLQTPSATLGIAAAGLAAVLLAALGSVSPRRGAHC